MSRVGHFFGKLFSGPPGRHELTLRAYGKLPLYAEYRRLEVSPGAPTAFSRWLDEGRLAWVQSAPQGETRGHTRPTRVVLHWPDQREWVIANIWGSHDSLGRRFPFSLFVTCPPEKLGAGPAQRWAACAALHAQLNAAHGQLATLGTGGDFYRLYGQRVLTVPGDGLADRAAELRREAADLCFSTWISATDLENRRPGAWFAALLRRAEHWKAQPDTLRAAALSVPLARGPAFDAQALLWLEWVTVLARPLGQEPWLMLPAPQAPGPARLVVAFRELLPGDFQLLTTDIDAYDYVEHIHRLSEGAPPPAGPDVAAPSGPLLDALLRHARA